LSELFTIDEVFLRVSGDAVWQMKSGNLSPQCNISVLFLTRELSDDETASAHYAFSFK
jgi:hypothetical protein